MSFCPQNSMENLNNFRTRFHPSLCATKFSLVKALFRDEKIELVVSKIFVQQFIFFVSWATSHLVFSKPV